MTEELSIRQQLDRLYREQTGKMLAYLISMLGDINLAEEVWHETFEKALLHWQKNMPEHPKAWLATVARNSAIDSLRKKKLSLEKSKLIQALSFDEGAELDLESDIFNDQQLKLIFTCCHPAIAFENQVALTLYSVCGLTTEQIAQSLILGRSTLEQRMTRAKQKIKVTNIPFVIPPKEAINERLNAVLKVIYLVFNRGFNDERLQSKPEVDLCVQAIELANLIIKLLPDSQETHGLLALMMFTLARRAARFDVNGQLVLLEKQNREIWDWQLIKHADEVLTQTLKQRQLGPYQLHAAIAGVHSMAKCYQDTDWLHIEALYQLLMQLDASPVIQLNAAVATAFARGFDKGIEKIQQIESKGELTEYSALHGAKADLFRRMGKFKQAKAAYQSAIASSHSNKEQEYFQKQLQKLKS